MPYELLLRRQVPDSPRGSSLARLLAGGLAAAAVATVGYSAITRRERLRDIQVSRIKYRADNRHATVEIPVQSMSSLVRGDD